MSYWAAKLGRWCLRRQCSTVAHYDTSQFRPRRAVVLTKVSRYEFEKIRHESLSEKQLELELTARGSNYAAIRHHHNIHKVDAEYWLLCIDLIYNINSHFFIFFVFQSLEVSVVEALEKAGIETRLVKRIQEYTDELVGWADMIVTTGGDGTFLMGASKIFDRNKPVIGFNTDPTRSEGNNTQNYDLILISDWLSINNTDL